MGNDDDLHQLELARRVVVACIFLEQPGRHIYEQRLISNAKFKCFDPVTAHVRVLEGCMDQSHHRITEQNIQQIARLAKVHGGLARVASEENSTNVLSYVKRVAATMSSPPRNENQNAGEGSRSEVIRVVRDMVRGCRPIWYIRGLLGWQ